MGQHGGAVVSTHSKKVGPIYWTTLQVMSDNVQEMYCPLTKFFLARALSMLSSHVLPMFVWVVCGTGSSITATRYRNTPKNEYQ